MKLRICAIAASVVTCLLCSAQSLAQNAYVVGSNGVSVIDTARNTVTTTIPIGPSGGVTGTPDGSKVFVTGDNSISVIDTTKNTVIDTIPVGASPGDIAVSPDGGRVYAADSVYGSPVLVIDAATNKVIAQIPLTPPGAYPFLPISLTAVMQGGKVYLYVLNGAYGGGVAVIDTTTNEVIPTIPVGGHADFSTAATLDGTKLYVTEHPYGFFDAILVVDTTTDTVEGDYFYSTGNYLLGDLVVSPDGRKLYVMGEPLGSGSPGVLFVFDTTTNEVIATIPLRAFCYYSGCLAITPDGSKVYVADTNDNVVSVIEATTNEVIATIPVEASDIFIAIPVPQSAPVAGNLCNGIYKGTFNGNLTVSAGQDCIFLNGRIGGNVNVVGGNFALNGSSVGGNLTVNGGGTYTLGPAATVGGNLQIQNIPAGSASNSVCGATVYGNMILKSDGTAVQIGSAAPLFCAGNTIGGSLEVVDNSSSALMFDNSVGGNMSVLDNTGPVDVVSNTVGGNLLCQGNTDLIMGSGNKAIKITRQCNASATAAAALSPLVPNGGGPQF
jgi:YVTN family beta-propeller protein